MPLPISRESFTEAAPQELAEAVYKAFCETLRELGVPVQTGLFGARMSVQLVNEGPVTIVL
jgi:D-tyrosyl-tRNA(Tyr) deacylase